MKKQNKRKMKILIVEPMARERRALAAVFRNKQKHLGDLSQALKKLQFNYEVFEAADAKGAMALCDAVHPDLVVICVKKNLNEGRELCQTIREREEERHTGIIFLVGSAEHSEFLPVECLEIGGDDVITARISPREMIARVNVVLRMKAMTDELRTANHKLEILSLTDDLTGLHNMRSFNMTFEKMLRHCRKGQRGLGVIMMDLDHFKSVNDESNHLVGSYVIAQAGKILNGIAGGDACAARYGGDEFILAMYCDSPQQIVQVAEKLRVAIATAEFRKDTFCGHITCSVGASYVESGMDCKPDDPIKAADVMLYRSKEHGRNQVNGMILRYPVDFDNISRNHLIRVGGPGNLKATK